MTTIPPAFPKRMKGVLPCPEELAEIVYVRIRSDLETCRELDFGCHEAIEEVLRAQRPILTELAGERAEALVRITHGLADCIFSRPPHGYE